jgi:hypothetical protein
MPNGSEERIGVVELIDSRGSLAVAELLASSTEPVSTLHSIVDAVMTLYWKRKDLPRVVLTGFAGIGAGFAVAHAASEVETREKLLGHVKALAFNIGSFTWPGWNEPGISPGATDLFIGLEAARTNLRLAVDLRKGDLPASRAHWLLGAHLISAQSFDEAIREFEESVVCAEKAGAAGERALAEAFAGLTAAATKTDISERRQGQERVRLALAKLREAGNPDDFIGQVHTAAAVFGWSDLLLADGSPS